ncbi:MAG: ATP-binding cassette domain-containing protein [Propionibacteriaceae bacterium]|nr:ATP-binding cassette domain-containing protein [Propionibacteriaceae bacterium]
MASGASLTARSISYGYRRGRPVLDGLDIDVPAGSLTALTGRSGRGKSTLLYLLAGLLTPWRGEVRHGEHDLHAGTDVTRSSYRAHNFGFIFQDVVLDARRSILEAVLEPCLYTGFSRRALVPRARSLMAELGVDLDPAALPGQISGGQAQRIGVCRALVLSPRVIFADEPTGNLDNDSTEAVASALAGAAATGCTVLVATHDDRIVSRCSARVEL